VLYVPGIAMVEQTFVKYLKKLIGESNDAVEWCLCLLSTAIIIQLLADKKGMFVLQSWAILIIIV